MLRAGLMGTSTGYKTTRPERPYLHAAIISLFALGALHEQTIEVAIENTTVMALIVGKAPFREDAISIVIV
jgi:hypothetical protein